LGAYSGSNVTSGSDNIALGASAGWNVETGSNNIDIGASGLSDESGLIRIGTPGVHAETFIAGIASTHLTGAQVVITPSGQLGVLTSSERYKTAITSMDSDSAKVLELRPVTFHLKTEPNGALQYGLIAEEVVKVYPDLVIRNDAGQIEGVRYDELTPILLRELQHQQQALTAQEKQFSAQAEQLAAQAEQLREIKQQFAQMAETNRQMQDALLKLQAKPSQVASR
jgi:flagellar capping protein FliD